MRGSYSWSSSRIPLGFGLGTPPICINSLSRHTREQGSSASSDADTLPTDHIRVLRSLHPLFDSECGAMEVMGWLGNARPCKTPPGSLVPYPRCLSWLTVPQPTLTGLAQPHPGKRPRCPRMSHPSTESSREKKRKGQLMASRQASTML